jgi:hypothetical protein
VAEWGCGANPREDGPDDPEDCIDYQPPDDIRVKSVRSSIETLLLDYLGGDSPEGICARYRALDREWIHATITGPLSRWLLSAGTRESTAGPGAPVRLQWLGGNLMPLARHRPPRPPKNLLEKCRQVRRLGQLS